MRHVNLLVLLLLAIAMPTYATVVGFTADLEPFNEVPPHATASSAFGAFNYDSVAHTLSYDVTFTNLSSPAAAGHVHFGAAGINGPVILPFSPGPVGTSGEVMGVWTNASLINQGLSGITTIDQAYSVALAGNLYSNIHDSLFPGGEIRGQLAVVPEPATFLLTASAALLFIRRKLRRE